MFHNFLDQLALVWSAFGGRMSLHSHWYLLDHNVDLLKSISQLVAGVLGVYVILSGMLFLWLLEAHMTEMSSFLAVFTLMSAGRTSETLHVWGITTSCTFVFCIGLFLSELSIYLWLSFICSVILLVFLLISGVSLSRLELSLFPLKLVMWQLCALVSQ